MMPLLTLLSRHDERALHALVLRRRPALDGFMRAITHLGDAWVIVPVVLLLVIGWLGAPRGAGVVAGVAMALSHCWVQLLKRSISRPRPRLPVGCQSLVAAPDRFSFPSGHSAATLSVALPLAMAIPPGAGGMVLAIAMLVGISRCYLGVHYPGDVLTGWFLAALGTCVAVAWLG